MSCPTCDATLQNLGLANDRRRVFWCPRCGTLKTEAETGLPDRLHHDAQAPSLVAHAAALVAALDDGYPVAGAAYLAKRAVREAATGRPDRE